MAHRGTTILLHLLAAVAFFYHDAGAHTRPALNIHGSPFETPPQLRIIDGEEVAKGTAPWMVSLQTSAYSTRMHMCGGVILNDMWILTTAFCASGVGIETFWVVAGVHNITHYTGEETFRFVEGIYFHPMYDYFTREYDIALLYLKNRLRKSRNIKPIQFLRNPAPYDRETCVLVGWGITNVDHFTETTVLMGVNQTVLERNVCKSVLSGYITDDVLCATDVGNGGGPCLGDWGGPLVCRGHELCGLASYAIGCGSSKTFPSVYTNATFFYDWVEETIELHTSYGN